MCSGPFESWSQADEPSFCKWNTFCSLLESNAGCVLSPAVIQVSTSSHALCGKRCTLWISWWLKLATARDFLPLMYMWRQTVAQLCLFSDISVSIYPHCWIQHNVLVSSRLVFPKLWPWEQIQSSVTQVKIYWHTYMIIYVGLEWNCFHTINTWKIFTVWLLMKSGLTLGL